MFKKKDKKAEIFGEMDARFSTLLDKAKERHYLKRIMEVNVTTTIDSDGFSRVVGEMKLSASENPNDPAATRTVPMQVAIVDKNPERAVAQALTHLNYLPMIYGDIIFEEGFFDLLEKKENEIAEIKQ